MTAKMQANKIYGIHFVQGCEKNSTMKIIKTLIKIMGKDKHCQGLSWNGRILLKYPYDTI